MTSTRHAATRCSVSTIARDGADALRYYGLPARISRSTRTRRENGDDEPRLRRETAGVVRAGRHLSRVSAAGARRIHRHAQHPQVQNVEQERLVPPEDTRGFVRRKSIQSFQRVSHSSLISALSRSDVVRLDADSTALPPPPLLRR